MKKLKENKGMSLIVFTVILAVLVVIAGGVIVYLLNNTKTERTEVQNPTNVASYNSSDTQKEDTNNDVKETEDQVNNKIYTYNDVKGTYEVTKKYSNNDDELNSVWYSLYLYEDGTYVYDYWSNLGAPFGMMGNYMINGKEIILNKLFAHYSDVSVTKEEGQIKLIINDDGSLTDKNNLLEDNKLKDIQLSKKSLSINKDMPSLSKSINTYISTLEEENKRK